MRLRATFWNVIRTNSHLLEGALRYGIIPMSPPPSPANETEMNVHYLIEPNMLDKVTQASNY